MIPNIKIVRDQFAQNFLPKASLIVICSSPLAFLAYGSLLRGLGWKATAWVLLMS